MNNLLIFCTERIDKYVNLEKIKNEFNIEYISLDSIY